MNANVRAVLIALVCAIVAAAALAVYLLPDGDDEPFATRLGGIENFVPARVVKRVPDVAFQDEDGDSVTLGAFRGKVVVLNLWATWCAPCIKELPQLDRLQAELEDKGVIVVALSLDRDGASKVRAFYDEAGIENLEVFVDPTMAAQKEFGAPGLPTTILIDRDGNERGRLVGPAEWDDERAIRLVLSANAPPS
jgi:thiol-disulfide isomerase/thioredoxin